MTPSQILLTIKACILLGLLGLAYYLGGASARVDLAQYKEKTAANTAKVANLATVASELARKAEQARALELAQIATEHEEKLHEIQSNSDRRLADLESGALRLRKLWAGCETDRLSDPVARAGELAGQDRLRRESAERVLRAVETLQAQRDGLQAVTAADRK